MALQATMCDSLSMASSGQTIVPIFDENSTFMGVWSLDPHPSEASCKAQLGNLAEPTWAVLSGNEVRRVSNASTDVGREVVFKNGVFLMVHGNPTPKESLEKESTVSFTCFFKDGFARLVRAGGTPRSTWHAPEGAFYHPIRGHGGALTGMWVADPQHPNLKERLEMFLAGEDTPPPIETFAALSEGRYRKVPNPPELGGGVFLMLGEARAPGERSDGTPGDQRRSRSWWQFWRQA